jgi:signal transduction protein with GAF and PtsI domain
MKDLPNISVDKHIEALTAISKAITSDRYIDDILRLVVTVTAEAMHSKICALWLLDNKEKTLHLRATQSISEEYLKERNLKVGEGIVGLVAQTNQPRMVLNVLEDPDYKEKELAEHEGLVSMLSVPMTVKDRVIGVINCYTSYPHKFSETEKNVLITVANEAAVAIENTELMVKTRVIQEELESRKLIERAKEILMQQRDLSGQDAYEWIRKRSMDTRKSMREIAEAIILMGEL